MTLSDQAATGSADREAVAIALGWRKIDLQDFHWVAWYGPTGSARTFSPPDYQNDLAATLAEIERRGWLWSAGSYPHLWLALRLPSGPWADDATATTIANAACAALLKALENSDEI